MTFPTFPSPKKHLAALAQALNDGKRPAWIAEGVALQKKSCWITSLTGWMEKEPVGSTNFQLWPYISQ